MPELVWGVLMGLGVWVLVGIPARPGIVSRIAPHLRDVSPIARQESRLQGVFDVLVALAPHPIAATRSWWRSRPTATRRLVDEEIATFLDRASVSLAAGVSVHSMWERLGRNSVGILGAEAATISRELSAGVSLNDAYRGSDGRLSHEGWSRFLAQLSSARRHGTPIADIVRGIAVEERSAAGRRLIEMASARETVMLLPLVFVILPMTVLVAVFPGIVALGSLPV
jgi:tight adherence protein C